MAAESSQFKLFANLEKAKPLGATDDKKPDNLEPAKGLVDQVQDAECTAEFQPLVKLEEVQTSTGEEEEEVLYRQRTRLYRFAKDTNEWKQRGTGECKFLKHKTHGRVRVLMRQEKTLKVVMNHLVDPNINLKANAGSDTSWVWTVEDYADGAKEISTFAIRFTNTDFSEQFKKTYEEAQATNKAIADGQDSKPDVEKKDDAEKKAADSK